MATYRSIAASETDANSPVTQTLMEALADNPTAITEGASGAPRNVLKSLEELAAGDTTRSRDSITTAGTSGGYDTVHAFNFIQIGTIRCVVQRVSGGSGINRRVSRVRNGVTTVLSTSSSDITLDVGVIPGDRILLLGDDGIIPSVYDGYFRTDGGNLWPGAVAKVEGNDV